MPPTQKNYLDPKTLNKIARLDVRARLVVEGFITGLHRSPYHGFAVEFAQHRQYVPGDEIKHIDWKVWSKTDRLYIKEYEEETNLKCTVLLDCSKSMRYGEHDKNGLSKFDYGATLAACLTYLLQKQQDAVGLVTFDRAIKMNLPASASPAHVKKLVHELEQTEPDDRTDVHDAFHSLAEQIRRRGMVVLISDLFVDLPALTEALHHFRHRRHEVVVFQIMHEHEIDFPFQDNTLFKGLEIEQELMTEPRALRKAYLEAKDRFCDEVRRTCATSGIDYVLLSTADPLDAALSSYLAFRQKSAKAARRA
jgi:uncharacterized protein (DUF58 family)